MMYICKKDCIIIKDNTDKSIRKRFYVAKDNFCYDGWIDLRKKITKFCYETTEKEFIRYNKDCRNQSFLNWIGVQLGTRKPIKSPKKI